MITLKELPVEILLQIFTYLPVCSSFQCYDQENSTTSMSRPADRMKSKKKTIYGCDLVDICLTCKLFRRIVTPELYRSLDLYCSIVSGLRGRTVEALLRVDHSGIKHIKHLSLLPYDPQQGSSAGQRPRNLLESKELERNAWKTKELDLSIIRAIIARFGPGQLLSLR